MTWSSSNNSIASVNSSGLVTAVSAGSATITVTTQDGNKTATSSITVNSNGVTIPSKIEAENYNSQSGTRNEPTTDVGGGQDVGYLAIGSYMNYNVNVLSAGSFTADLRIASPNNGSEIQIKSGSTILTRITVPNTGGWQNWQTITTPSFNLPAGLQTLQIYVSISGYNINWLQFNSAGSVPASSISVSPSSLSLLVGASSTLTASVNPSNASNKNVTWSSSNNAVATVNSSGLVSGVSAGSATITVTTQDGGKTATSMITVNATGNCTWAFAANENGTVNISGTKQVRYGANGVYYTQTFTNSTIGCNNSVFGDPVPGVSKTCEICNSSSSVSVNGVTVSPATINISIGSTGQLTANISPSNATNKNVVWTSANTAIATVSSSGLITAVATGNVNITATTQDGGFSSISSVTVSSSSNANLALNKPYAAGSASYNNLSNAFDGNTSTKVNASQNSGGNEILATDLGSNASINSIKVTFDDLANYQVQGSADGANWTNIGSKITSPSNPNTTTYSGVTYRYIRCNFDPNFIGGSGYWNPGIKEIEVYGNLQRWEIWK